MLAVIRLTAVQPRPCGRGIETSEQAGERSKFDLALVAVLSDAGLRRSEASSLTWGDVQCWNDGRGRVTVVHFTAAVYNIRDVFQNHGSKDLAESQLLCCRGITRFTELIPAFGLDDRCLTVSADNQSPQRFRFARCP